MNEQLKFLRKLTPKKLVGVGVDVNEELKFLRGGVVDVNGEGGCERRI